MTEDAATLRAWIGTIGICFLTTVLEGLDIQAVGVAAPKLVREFGLAPSQSGLLFSAGPLGLFFGAALGGWLGDRFSRRWALAGSIVAFGVFSLAMTAAPNVASLILVRLLTGVGLGGAMPNLIAVTADATPPRWKRTVATALWIGTPIGGLMAAQLARDLTDWRMIFAAGGLGPILLAPLVLLLIPKGRQAHAAKDGQRLWSELFAPARRWATLSLWAAYFFTLLLLHLFLNWLPLLVAGEGHPPPVAAAAAFWFNLGGCLGTIVFALGLAAARPLYVVGGVYLAMSLSMLALARVGDQADLMLMVAFLTGALVISTTFILYGLSPELYASHLRGAGVGAAVAAGRAGSVVGPVAVGLMLSGGLPPSAVLLRILPLALIAGLAAAFAFRSAESSRRLAA
jgi:AAHS family 3-hydroxyphenylpropionic acid transporter